MTAESFSPQTHEQGDSYDHFLAGLTTAAQGWSGREPVMSRFFTAVHELATISDEIATEVANYAESETAQGNPTAYAVNKMFKAAQRVMLDESRRELYSYPTSFTRPYRWKHVLPMMFLGKGTDEYDKFSEALMWNDRKNRPERAKAAAYAATMLLGRTTIYDGLLYHEYGSSLGLNLKALASNDLDKAEMYNNRGGIYVKNNDATAGFYAGTRNAQLREGIGVDILPPKPPDDPGYMDQVDDYKAFSLTPKELDRSRKNARTRNKEETFDRFALMQPEKQITILQDDITEPSAETHATLRANKADVVFLSHVPSQIMGEFDFTIKRILDNYLEPRGIIVMNEYARIDRAGHMKIADDWAKEWQVITAVMEGASPEAGFIPFMRWRTSHCTEGTIVRGALRRFTSTRLYLR